MAGFILPLIMHILYGVEDMPVELGGTSAIIPKNFVGAGYICAMFIVSCHVISMFTGRFASLPAVSLPLHERVWQADASLHHYDLVI
jgi:succinate dehydrogenase/fumarate reductase cytochrome b subunit